MGNKIIGKCPSCGKNMVVSELKCTSCDIKLVGEFNLSRFDYLSDAQQEFALVFLKNAGNIKDIEKDLNISYPTVKKMLNDLIVSLGFDKSIEAKVSMSKEEIYEALRKKEITLDEAEVLLKEDDNE